MNLTMTAEAEIAALCAEVERLDAANTAAEQSIQNLLSDATVAKSSLAEARALLARIVKYAIEDRASTPGTTRLARVVVEADDWLKANLESPRAEGTTDYTRGFRDGFDTRDKHALESPRAAAERAVLKASSEMIIHEYSIGTGTKRLAVEGDGEDVARAELELRRVRREMKS